jgi:hypothetical protein
MSLLDDVSIVVTPNGYKAGELYGGGAEITIDGARINNTVTGVNAYIAQTLTGTLSGKQFVLTYDVITTNGEDLSLEQASGLVLNTSTTGVNRKLYFTWDKVDSKVTIKRINAGTDVTIDNVSVKEYTSADMDVTRATAATRVDENGLVNYAEVIGDSVLTGNNSNFDTGIGSWVTYNGGTLAHSTDKLEVTRNQDIFTRDGIGSLINSTEGVLFVEMAALADDLSFRYISLSDGTSSDAIKLYYTISSNSITLQVRRSGSLEVLSIFSKRHH